MSLISTRSTSVYISIPTSIGIAQDSSEIMPSIIKAFVTCKGVIVGSAIGSQGNCSSLKSCQSPLTYLVALVAQSQISWLQTESIPVQLIGSLLSYQVPSDQDSQQQSNLACDRYSKQTPSQALEQYAYSQAYSCSGHPWSDGLSSTGPSCLGLSYSRGTLKCILKYYPLSQHYSLSSFGHQVCVGLLIPTKLQ